MEAQDLLAYIYTAKETYICATFEKHRLVRLYIKLSTTLVASALKY